MIGVGAILVCLPGTACRSKAAPPDGGPALDTAPAVDSAFAPASPLRLPSAYAAARCSDCHEPMFDEWQLSAHARAGTSALFTLMRDKSGPAGQGCDECHLPLKGRAMPGAAVEEGVTCEACHSITGVEDKGESAITTFRVGRVKQGPLCDAKRHYFHDMGCSKLHEQSLVCAGCHLWSSTTEKGISVPVFTEFAEWRESAAKKGISCQDCHMPTSTREVARGSPPRPGVPHHGFLVAPAARGQALSVSATVSDADAAIGVNISIRNQGVGHSFPSGLPGKQVVLRAVVVDAEGHEVGREERAYARVLIDDSGAEVPFYAATRVGSDTRLAPEATRDEAFSFDVTSAGEVRIDVVTRDLSPALAKALGVALPAETPVAHARAAFGAKGAKGRPHLPKTVSATP